MRIWFIILIVLVLFITGCSSQPSIQCRMNSDCKSVGGCIIGCYNKYHLPTQPRDEMCGQLGPFECSCIDSVCVDTGINPLTCDNYLCLNPEIDRVRFGESAIFVVGITNKDNSANTFKLDVYQTMAEDNYHNPIKYTLNPIIGNNTIILDASKSDKRVIKIIPTKETPSGNYLFNVSIESEDKKIIRTEQIYVEIN